MGAFWGRSGVDFRPIWRSTGRSDQKRPTITKHCACAVKQASSHRQTTQNSIGNHCRRLLRNALRKGCSKKWSRGSPGRLGGDSGAFRTHQEHLRTLRGSSEAPLDASRECPQGPPARPRSPQGPPERFLFDFVAIWGGFGSDLGPIWGRFAPVRSRNDTSRCATKALVQTFLRAFSL